MIDINEIWKELDKPDPYHKIINGHVVAVDPSEAAKTLGKRGGEATKAKLGVDHFKRISKLGVKARNK